MLDIVQYPAEVLRRPAEPVTEITGEIAALARSMIETMYAAPGVGLAAPQVNQSLRMFVMDPGGEEDKRQPAVVINPRIIESVGEATSEEGCLSIPGYYAEVPRAKTIHVQFLDAHGNPVERTLSDFPAFVFQHEFDHLDGILFVDYLSRTRHRLFERDYGRDPWRWKFRSRR
ncbi:MAG: peptide deformylase [Candidatus Dadabacteria bacterium]|nr:MAG: peptide deformylase [Candidatus Dadabacteria bacterium]